MAVRPKTISYDFPKFVDTIVSTIKDNALKSVFRNLTRELEKFHTEVTKVVNVNKTAITFVSQNDAPSPGEGEIYLWKDADATSGNPTHYLIANDGTSTVTFASEETVP